MNEVDVGPPTHSQYLLALKSYTKTQPALDSFYLSNMPLHGSSNNDILTMISNDDGKIANKANKKTLLTFTAI